MACVICEDRGYEGQYVEEMHGVVCLSCLEQAELKLRESVSAVEDKS